MAERAWLLALLAALGIGWGLTQPLAKIAVSEGYQPLGLIVWQQAIVGVVLGGIVWATARRRPRGARQWGACLAIALIGTIVIIPNSASYRAAVFLPSGVLSILLSLVPMMAFPIALALGVDRFRWLRLAGLALGLLGVLILLAPGAALPDPAMIVFVPLAMVAPFFYAFEGNAVARWGTAGLDPIELLFGASVIGFALSVPMALATGQWIDPRPPWSLPDLALLLSSLVHGAVYTGYVWMVGRAGSVFAAQVSYLVTGSGIVWAMVLLGESYTAGIWMSAALIVAGMLLVQPRPKALLAEA